MASTFSVHPSTIQHSQSDDDFHRFTNDDTICMEYLKEVRRIKDNGTCHVNLDPSSHNNSTRHKIFSPYLQKLPHSNFLQHNLPPPQSSITTSSRRHTDRRRSNSTSRHHKRSSSAQRSKEMNHAYHPSSNVVDGLDLSCFFGNDNEHHQHHTLQKKSRPVSAPTRTVASQKKKQRRSIGSRSQKDNFIVILYRNGDRDKCVYCRSTTIDAILLYATEKLQMPLAARRLFDENGREAYRSEDIRSQSEYYVSSGENFKNPFDPIKVQTEYGLNSVWTMQGIKTLAIKPKTFTTTTKISKRLEKQIKLNVNLMIFENGFGTNDTMYQMLIDTVLKENFEKFLEDCTIKIELNAHAKKAYNYRGDEIKSLKIFVESDDNFIKTVHGSKIQDILGPIWISKGERFRPKGAYKFLALRLEEGKRRLKKEKTKQEEVHLIQKYKKQKKSNQSMIMEDLDDTTTNGMKIEIFNNDSFDKKNIKDKKLLSMTIDELNELDQTMNKSVEELQDMIENYKLKMAEIELEKDEEERMGANFATEHIKEIKSENKIVGRHPICLHIHENGNYNKNDPKIYLNIKNLPSKNAGQTSIEYLLDYLQQEVDIYSRQRPKRVFDINGIEFKLLNKLKQNQDLFISYGEDYKPAFKPCMSITLVNVEVYEKDGQLALIKSMSEDFLKVKKDTNVRQIIASWKPLQRISNDIERKFYNKFNDEQKTNYDKIPLDDHISPNVTLLGQTVINTETNKHSTKLIYPDLKIEEKFQLKPEKSELFPKTELQLWRYSKDGYIFNKILSRLTLTVVDQPIRLSQKSSALNREYVELVGYGVCLQPKTDDKQLKQLWTFTADGYIVSQAYPNYALTNLSTIVPTDNKTMQANGIRMEENDPSIYYIGICPKCNKKSPFIHAQRWGIRQQSGFTIGDWKYSKVENPAWHKMALTWPVDGSGTLIPELQWPIEGYFIPGVPPVKSIKLTPTTPAFVPIRLQVLKNGERDLGKAVAVVGPDMSNMLTENKTSPTIYRRLRIPKPEKEQRANRQLRRMADARQREIKLFLEDCTNLLNLPFAGRRLFDKDGYELFDLTSIQRDSHVYVTCGEAWIDPELTKAEQQRRLLLAYLKNDVNMIDFYCSLRNPVEYCIETKNGLCENSQLIVNICALNSIQRERVKQGETIEQVIEYEVPVVEAAPEPEARTAHERAHIAVDKKLKEKFRWPWEKIANRSLTSDTDDDGSANETINNSLTRDKSPPTKPILNKSTRNLPKTVRISMQSFKWEESGGYISCSDDPNLVFGVKEIEAKIVEVVLRRRNPDDIFQRWLIKSTIADNDNDNLQPDDKSKIIIVSKARPTMALTILLPSCTGSESNENSVSCVGCSVSLQVRRTEENGCANQKWTYDKKLGFLFAFSASTMDKEITAANRANICSYTVVKDNVSQPGYMVSIINSQDQTENVAVCLACAKSMRGKYRLIKMKTDIEFSCAIGQRQDLKFNGSFHCLNHKVDLSENVAENTLSIWKEKYDKLKEEASVRAIAKEIAAAKSIQTVHLLAYRNGDGHTKIGQILVGSSIIGLLDQATQRLNLTNAARRFYTVDGNVMLTIEDLLQWTSEYYKKKYNKWLKPEKSNETHLSQQIQHESQQPLDKIELYTSHHQPMDNETRKVHTDTVSEKTTLSSTVETSTLAAKQRHQNLPKPSDIKNAVKKNVSGTIEIDMNQLLKFPIEIWVSSGESFVNPKDVDQRQNQRILQREQRTTVEHELEKEKHSLRLMQGRRISAQQPGEFISQQNPQEPVIKQGHWTEQPDIELDKIEDVEQLRTSLDEIRMSQQPENTRLILTAATDRLVQHPKTKRVLVYTNLDPANAVQCFGSSLEEIMENSKLKLHVMQPIQALFDENGQLIERFDQIRRDQLICVSTTKTFTTVTERQKEVEIKANWARTRKNYGDAATDIRVNSSLSFPSVDPFGPPLLTIDDQQQLRPLHTVQTTTKNSALAIEQPPRLLRPTTAKSRVTRTIIEQPQSEDQYPIATSEKSFLTETDMFNLQSPESTNKQHQHITITYCKQQDSDSVHPTLTANNFFCPTTTINGFAKDSINVSDDDDDLNMENDDNDDETDSEIQRITTKSRLNNDLLFDDERSCESNRFSRPISSKQPLTTVTNRKSNSPLFGLFGDDKKSDNNKKEKDNDDDDDDFMALLNKK